MRTFPPKFQNVRYWLRTSHSSLVPMDSLSSGKPNLFPESRPVELKGLKRAISTTSWRESLEQQQEEGSSFWSKWEQNWEQEMWVSQQSHKSVSSEMLSFEWQDYISCSIIEIQLFCLLRTCYHLRVHLLPWALWPLPQKSTLLNSPTIQQLGGQCLAQHSTSWTMPQWKDRSQPVCQSLNPISANTRLSWAINLMSLCISFSFAKQSYEQRLSQRIVRIN